MLEDGQNVDIETQRRSASQTEEAEARLLESVSSVRPKNPLTHAVLISIESNGSPVPPSAPWLDVGAGVSNSNQGGDQSYSQDQQHKSFSFVGGDKNATVALAQHDSGHSSQLMAEGR